MTPFIVGNIPGVIALAKNKPTIDHVIPTRRGGSNNLSNLVLACRECNTRKGNKSLESLGWSLG